MKYLFASVVTVAALSCSEPSQITQTNPANGISLVRSAGLPGTASAVAALVAPRSTPTRSPAAAVTGEGPVLPAAYATMMGDAENTYGHARANMRYQQVFLGTELGANRAFRALCLRRDETYGGSEWQQDITLKLGPTSFDHGTISTVFDANYSAPPTTVFSGIVTLPFSDGGGTVDDFYICIEFETNYVHPSGSNLIVELVNRTTEIRIHFDDFCDVPDELCTTRRVYALSADATVGETDGDNAGLIMKLVTAQPRSRSDCLQGGWKNYGFRNPGECMRRVRAVAE